MREAGDVCYADVYKDGTGVVEFLRKEDMKYAVRKLDDSKFRSHEVKMIVLSLQVQRMRSFILTRNGYHLDVLLCKYPW